MSDPLYEGLAAAAVDFAVFLPDSVLYRPERRLQVEGACTTVVCSREDEGVAIACGAALAGRRAVVMMEGSGLGLCGLILARAQSQRTPLLVVFSHVRTRGDPADYHISSRLAGEGTCIGLGIPYEVLRSPDEARTLLPELMATAVGQKTVVALGVPGGFA